MTAAAATAAATEMATPDETAAFLAESGLLDRMGARNLQARGARTAEEYLLAYRSGLHEWDDAPPPLRERALRLMGAARERCVAAGFLALGGMPWRMALSSGPAENGWPHTVGDVMVIPVKAIESRPDEDLVRLLVHEAVHVAQRRDPEAARELVVARLGFREASPELAARVRALGEQRVNPDTDDAVYELDGRVCHPVLQLRPSSLAHVRMLPDGHHPRFRGLADNHEHPFEIMAELVASEVAPLTRPARWP